MLVAPVLLVGTFVGTSVVGGMVVMVVLTAGVKVGLAARVVVVVAASMLVEVAAGLVVAVLIREL